MGEENMANLVLVAGANDSGKSVYAEQLIAQTTGKRYYVATMAACTEENHRRIEKHRQQRKELAFETLECPYEVGNCPVEPDGVVLLEDVSNLLANGMFVQGKMPDEVLEDICTLMGRCRVLVVVTISGLNADGYEAETREYINGLNAINQKLFEKADAAVVMENLQPVYKKGGIHDLA